MEKIPVQKDVMYLLPYWVCLWVVYKSSGHHNGLMLKQVTEMEYNGNHQVQ